MKREIKFRAWGKRKQGDNIMYSPATLQQWIESIWSKPEDFVWMQFAGLTDKNGGEIYEGDAFPCIYKRDGHIDHHYYVIFNGFSGAFEYQRVGNPCPQNQVHQGMRDAARQECIGNIYENPELLSQ